MRLLNAAQSNASRYGLPCLGLLLAISTFIINQTVAFATAEEEPTKLAGLMQEPLQISENPANSYQAGDANQFNSKYTSLVSNYISSRNKALAWDEVNSISQAIVSYSLRYGVDYRLLTSLISVESSFRRDVVSSSGAIGMGQLKPDTAKWLGVVDPYDPIDNIAGTARFLSWLVKKYNGNLESALSAYYQGPGFVDRNGVTDQCMPYLEKINRALVGLI